MLGLQAMKHRLLAIASMQRLCCAVQAAEGRPIPPRPVMRTPKPPSYLSPAPGAPATPAAGRRPSAGEQLCFWHGSWRCDMNRRAYEKLV